LAIASCGGSDDEPAPGPPFTVKILAFNDYHGTLESPGTFGANTAVPVADRPPVGGAAYLAAHVKRLQATNPNNTVVGAGDFIGASPLVSASFFDEPSIETLNRIGMEFSAVGNHEFDRGSAELLRLQNGGCKRNAASQPEPNSCRGAAAARRCRSRARSSSGSRPTSSRRRRTAPCCPLTASRASTGVQVAFIGMTLEATPTIVTPTGVAGLAFRDEADTVNALVPELRALGVESIVVLVHEGGFQTGALSDINGCEGQLAGSAIAGIVARFDNAVDAVVSGHTHAAYNCRLPNATGRSILVTSASASAASSPTST
jgi:5'-nucleotidase